MSKSTQPHRRRSLKIIGKIFKFGILMLITFVASFAATVIIKSDDPSGYFDSVSEEFSYNDEPARSSGAPEIKTLFDERNRQPFDAEKSGEERDKKISDEKKSTDERIPDDEPTPLARGENKIGLFARVGRMTSIKPAVEEKIKAVPHYVPLGEIPYTLRQAVVAVEDARFYDHRGFDVIGIARAVFVNVEAGEIQEGASTITQQTVKNLFLTSDRTFTRKFEELVLAMDMEKNFSKDKILEVYLNSIYFGSNFYGIYDAAHGYFDKEPVDLTLGECTMLAGLPNAPSIYSPYVDFRSAKKRQLVVIDAMEKMGVITKTEAESARIEEIVLKE